MIGTILAGAVRLLTGCRPRGVPGSGPSVPRVYIGNHTSNLDALVIWASLPPEERRRCRPVAAQDYWTGGPVRRLLAIKGMKAILIERHKVTRENNPMIPMCDALRDGCALILFPEGKRVDQELPGEFRPGIYHIARELPQTEFVPVYLLNLNRILPKGEFLIVPVIASAWFGEPLKLQEGAEKEAFLERARKAVLELAEDEDDVH